MVLVTTTAIPANFLARLDAATFMQLEQAADICRDRQHAAAQGSRSLAVWTTKFDRIHAEVERRGHMLIIAAPGCGWSVVAPAEYSRIVNDPRRVEAFRLATLSTTNKEN